MIDTIRRMLVGGERVTLTEIKMTPMQTMARYMWAPFLLMGLMILFGALGLSVVTANFASDYFGVPKAVREAANAPGSLIDKRQFIETTRTWLPAFKLLGVGLILGGITFALATILGTFRVGGGQVQQAFGHEPQSLKPPVTAHLFPMFMMLGVLILVTNLAISIAVAVLAHGVYAHPIAEIDAATAGSALSDHLQTVQTYKTWLEPFKFVGIASLLTGIAFAVHTILQVIRFQAQRIRELAMGR